MEKTGGKVLPSRGPALLIGLTGILSGGAAAAAEGTTTVATGTIATTALAQKLFWLAPAGAALALLAAVFFYKKMMGASEGDAKMIEISGHVRAGAYAYLRRQYGVVTIVFIVLSLLFAVLAYGLGVQNKFVPLAFLTGGFFSGLAGFIGMKTATAASHRTTAGARESLNRGLQVAFRSGAVMGLTVVGLGLVDIVLWYSVLNWIYNHAALFMNGSGIFVTGFADLTHQALAKGDFSLLTGNSEWVRAKYVEITTTMLTFGMGASTQALFARVGGGIFTKAADVGADLVGKVEAGIPEDDPRNPATIADNVGDNVGDVAGMGADLYESYCGSILAAAALGAASYPMLGLPGLLTPMIIAGIGNLLSVVGIFAVRTEEGATQKNLLKALGRGINLSTGLIIVACFAVCWFLLPDKAEYAGATLSWINVRVFTAIITGLLAGWIIGKATEYYTSDEYKPTKGIAGQSRYGPATIVIDGVATGMFSTWIPVVTIAAAILIAYFTCGGNLDPTLGLYGVSVAAVGMLSTLGITLATDAYGPIADNAGGNAEMSGQEPIVRERTDALDSLGNTTAATGKGFAIGSAALTALALMAAYIEETKVFIRSFAGAATDGTYRIGKIIFYSPQKFTGTPTADMISADKIHLPDLMKAYNVVLLNPLVLVGVFMGAMLVFLFCALTLKAVGRAAGAMVAEVRRQFKEIPGIMQGKATPDYARCVAISTAGAQREMMLPSLLAITVPVVVGLVLGVAGVLGLLAGGLACGFVVAIFMANAGGAWDNAKKHIERGEFGGKKLPDGSQNPNHAAAVVGDTVGDPFKDTSGPSLNILIKLMSMVSVVAVGVIVAYSGIVQHWLGFH